MLILNIVLYLRQNSPKSKNNVFPVYRFGHFLFDSWQKNFIITIVKDDKAYTTRDVFPSPKLQYKYFFFDRLQTPICNFQLQILSYIIKY